MNEDYKIIEGNKVHKTAIINWKKLVIGKGNIFGPYSIIGTDAQWPGNKSFGKITFMVRSEFEDSTWNKIVDFVKSKGFEVTQDSNYYDIEPGEREWFPSINFNFNSSNI